MAPSVGPDGQILDDTGKPTGYRIKSNINVRTPQEVGHSVGGFVKRNIVPAGLLSGAGLALDLVAPEAGLPATLFSLLRPVAMGAANVATNKLLPEDVGGDPNASVLGGFAAGALPEASVMGGSAGLEKLLNKRLEGRVTSASEGAIKKLDPEALATRAPLMAPRGAVPYPGLASGTQLTDQTFAAQKPVLSTVQAARTKYGSQIGDAYRALKGEEPVDATGFAQQADQLQQSMISPASGQAQGLLNEYRMLDPEAQRAAWEKAQAAKANPLGANAGTVSSSIELPGGEIVVPGKPQTTFNEKASRQLNETAQNLGYRNAAAMPDNLRNRLVAEAGLTPEALPSSQIPQATDFTPQPAKLDQLRNLRQKVNTALRTAKGGDYYLLGQLQDRLDSQLMDHLPDNMSDLRKQYAGFINRWGYGAEQQFKKLKNPQEIADWMFSDPHRAFDLFHEANPQQQDDLRGLFIQHVYGGLNDTTQSAKQQVEHVRQQLAPYMRDKQTAAMVFGPNAGEQMRLMASWPKFTADFKEQWDRNPSFRKQFTAGMRQQILEKKIDPDQAATNMVRQLSGQSPMLQQMIAQLPAPAAQAGGGRIMGMRAPLFHGAMLATGLGTTFLTGKMGMGVPWQVAALSAWLITDRAASFSAASKLGLTRPLLNALQSKSGYLAGRGVARALLTTGTRNLQQSVDQPVELQ